MIENFSMSSVTVFCVAVLLMLLIVFAQSRFRGFLFFIIFPRPFRWLCMTLVICMVQALWIISRIAIVCGFESLQPRFFRVFLIFVVRWRDERYDDVDSGRFDKIFGDLLSKGRVKKFWRQKRTSLE